MCDRLFLDLPHNSVKPDLVDPDYELEGGSPKIVMNYPSNWYLPVNELGAYKSGG